MNNAFNEPQTVVLLGGTSEIGLAIVRSAIRPATRHVVLACRDLEAGESAAREFRSATLRVDVVQFDAADVGSHPELLERLVALVGDLDLVVVAFAQLGGPATAFDPAAAASLAHIDFTAAVSAVVASAQVLRGQGHGSLVVLSSVAGERVRRGNPVYGGAKAGLDGFCQGLGDGLADDGVHLLLVRPGFVHSRMTTGMEAAPFATTPDVVAEATMVGLRRGRRIVWAPGLLRWVFVVLRHLPGPVWRRLPLG